MQVIKVTYVKTRRICAPSSLCREAEGGQISGVSDRECLRCQLGNYAEKKAKGKTTRYVQTSRVRLLRDILFEGPAVVLDLTDAVTCTKAGCLYLAQGKEE